MFDTDKAILEKNLYGVDINEESVEIAKLSLWLRTAQKGRKLSNLNNNIKCGNSLIDDPEVAGEKAFNWQKEFPGVFQKKNKKAWHVTWVTHDTRTSARMIKYKVKERRANGEMHIDRAIYLDDKDALKVTEIISHIVIEEKYNCLAYNINEDHVHMLLVCDESELTDIVRKLKGKSAQKFKEHLGLAKGETFNLWAQKFNRKLITSEKQLANTIKYITNNREKHRAALNEQGVATPCSESEQEFLKQFQPLVQKMTCTREHAFRNEYKGGFDVVIGNPPYVQLQSMGEMSNKLAQCGYETFHKGGDLYCLFSEQGYRLLKQGGVQSFIMPNKWMIVAYGKPLRKFLSNTNLLQVLNFGDIQFFQEATTYVCIFVTQKKKPQNEVEVLSLNKKTYKDNFFEEVKSNLYKYHINNFSEKAWSIQPYQDALVLKKMKSNSISLKNLPITINYGIKTGFNDAFFIDESTKAKLIAADYSNTEIIKPMVRGRDIAAYGITGFEYLIGTFPSLHLDIEKYPAIKNHLLSFGFDRLKQTGEKGSRKKTKGQWFETQDSIAYHKEFSKPKIIYPNMTSVFPFMYDESGFYGNDKSFILTANNNSVSLPFLTALFNSSLAKLWIWYNCPELQGGTREIRKVYFENFPVPEASTEQSENLSMLAIERTKKTSELQEKATRFINRIKSNFEIEKITTKLQKFYNFDFKTFVAELKKQKVKLSLVQQDEWEEYFNSYQSEINQLQTEIDKTDKEIDQMVYQLYDLTDEEIAIVENSIK